MDEHKDKGWAWIILIITFLSRVNMACLGFNTGVLNVALLEYFEQSVAATAIFGSVFYSSVYFIGPIASMIINHFGCRAAHIFGSFIAFIGFSSGYFVKKLEIFILTYGLLGGVGIGICYTNVTIIPSFYFKKYHGLSIGITAAGSSVGIFVSGLFCQYLLDTYGLNGTCLMIGGMILHEVLFGSLMFPIHRRKCNESTQNQTGRKKIEKFKLNNIFQLSILQNKTYVIILFCDLLWTVPYSMIFYHLPNFAVKLGSSHENSAFLITALGAGGTINRFLTGLAVGPDGIDPLLLFLGFNGILGGITLSFPSFFTSHVSRLIYSFLFGMYTGGLTALKNPLCMEIVGVQYISTAIGLFFLLEGVAYICGPPIAGLIADRTGSYEYSFYLSGAIFIATFLLTLVASMWKKENILEAHHETIAIEEEDIMEKELEPLATKQTLNNQEITDTM